MMCFPQLMLKLESHVQDCGHDAVNDEALFNSSPRLGGPPAGAPPGLTGLAFDERMTMHAEQSSSPHPERPDRIRAVIARLQASGLAGMHAVVCIRELSTRFPTCRSGLLQQRSRAAIYFLLHKNM
jgi:hypothetical protein